MRRSFPGKSRDVKALMDVIREEVYRQHGVTLEPEVEILTD